MFGRRLLPAFRMQEVMPVTKPRKAKQDVPNWAPKYNMLEGLRTCSVFPMHTPGGLHKAGMQKLICTCMLSFVLPWHVHTTARGHGGLHLHRLTFVYAYINNCITHLRIRCIRECGFPKAGMGTEFQTGAKRKVSTNIYAYACANTNTYILTSKPAKGPAGRGNIGKHDASFHSETWPGEEVRSRCSRKAMCREAGIYDHACVYACLHALLFTVHVHVCMRACLFANGCAPIACVHLNLPAWLPAYRHLRRSSFQQDYLARGFDKQQPDPRTSSLA